ncbi:uncharacterized protein LOC119177954 [Rhipicephalus microplus]|uniref:uncharacterized protein LOC119177954 n=1 Tax=Rhipicephalus microplus TaxID=6941 RepID=UPI003F6A94DE
MGTTLLNMTFLRSMSSWESFTSPATSDAAKPEHTRRYCCNFCDYKDASPSGLQQHIRVHTVLFGISASMERHQVLFVYMTLCELMPT